MKVLLMGALGSMGSRYCAILKHLGVDYSIYDVQLRMSLESAAQGCDRVLIATPTQAHTFSIRDAIRVLPGKPILCEKPITKDMVELSKLIAECAEAKSDLRVVFQYKRAYLDDFGSGPTHYNFYRHGGDGLYWDCIQIIGLARGLVTLREDSPIWDCVINGTRLSIADMDRAYVAYLADWLHNPELCVGVKDILSIHKKVQELIDARS